MLALLKEQGYIDILADTYGTHISICNYDRFQDLDNYKTDSNETQVKRKRNGSETQVSINNKDKKDNNDKKEPKTFSSDSVEYRLSELLFSEILKRNPKHKKPNLRSWAQHIDRLIRLDRRDTEEIERVIRWCQRDTFWQNNILSTSKLRDQYDQLILKMGSKDKKPGFSGLSDQDYHEGAFG
jgi:hypothetical protein